ncbi:hypothetical protein PSM_B0248 [Pseudoalteromonas sp. SM9913]|nr:hypothetical protein PSM_B0248 [Pseudoalteromonas sp. SM9913]
MHSLKVIYSISLLFSLKDKIKYLDYLLSFKKVFSLQHAVLP